VSALGEGEGARRPWKGWAPLLALAVVGLLVFLPRRVGINLSDEGFLWYGVQRVLAGEVPMRDFQAYDPGRYYWCAALTPLVGDGVLGVRAAAALFAAGGLALALLVAARFARHPLELALCALVLGLWLFPRHKLFEPALASAAAWFALRLFEAPSVRAHLSAGLFVGASAFFGRNHALYAGLALGASALLVAWKRPELRGPRPFGALALGVALGLVPLVGMLLLVPGFAGGYRRSLELVLEHGANLALPYPFPWREPWSSLAGWELAGRAALAAAFLAPFVLLPLGLVLSLRTPGRDLAERAPLLAATLVGLVYVHHVAVRSDPPHLAQCFAPLALLALALPTLARPGVLRAGAWTLVLALSAAAASEANPALAPFRPDARGALVDCTVAGERLRLAVPQARTFEALQTFAQRELGDAPLWVVNQPTLYAALGRRAPSWWLFFYWPEDEAAQRMHVRMLEEERVEWVLVNLGKPEGLETQDFTLTHPLVWGHLRAAYRPVPLEGLSPKLQLLRLRS
jgi:hypothetical protein